MSIDIGIIGLPQSGKTTIFNGLTKGKADIKGFIPKGSAPHLGTASVPEPRLDMLASMLNPKKVVHAEAKYIDIGASVKELAQETGIGGQLLNQLSTVDALINVVRAFKDDRIPRIEGSLDIERDIAAMNLELIFSDLAIIERRLARIAISLKGAQQAERQAASHEQALLIKLKAVLENNAPIRELALTPDESKSIANYQFLTAKPLLIAVNIGEEQLPEAASLEESLNSQYSQPNCRVITLCAKLETELTQLDNSSAKEFQAEFSITEPGLERIIRLSYELLGLVTFFTTASDELKAWPIKKNTGALKAAGKIHSDIERGFIRAEVISYDDLLKCGSISEARKQGLLRLEGKSYTVQDGDVITFLFNV